MRIDYRKAMKSEMIKRTMRSRNLGTFISMRRRASSSVASVRYAKGSAA
jgi:hypothetical protein